ncbi:hypothetical protein G6F50_015961 [Rhizopus delemar]|uniref:Uncharacterized protein n=1 Tax=Rhizopus delemar TaxID=936053 RepID=A0A9P6XV24_9FUNG|nr:hypothetical protein G6F50_015961 [Rhizopus delemar]
MLQGLIQRGLPFLWRPEAKGQAGAGDAGGGRRGLHVHDYGFRSDSSGGLRLAHPPAIRASEYAQNNGATPITAPNAPKVNGRETCDPLISAIRRPTASAARPGGECWCSRDSILGCQHPKARPRMNDSKIRTVTSVNSG